MESQATAPEPKYPFTEIHQKYKDKFEEVSKRLNDALSEYTKALAEPCLSERSLTLSQELRMKVSAIQLERDILVDAFRHEKDAQKNEYLDKFSKKRDSTVAQRDECAARIAQLKESLKKEEESLIKLDDAVHTAQICYMLNDSDYTELKEDKVVIATKIAIYLREKALAFIGKHDRFLETVLAKMKEFQKETEFPNLVKEAAALEAAIIQMCPPAPVASAQEAPAPAVEAPAPVPLVRVESGPLIAALSDPTTPPPLKPHRRSERIASRPRRIYREFDESDT